MAGGLQKYRVVVTCTGVPEAEGQAVAADIVAEFAEHRRHHENAQCDYEAGHLTLTVENDFDEDGAATVDEFADCISAYLAVPFDGHLEVKSVAYI